MKDLLISSKVLDKRNRMRQGYKAEKDGIYFRNHEARNFCVSA